MKEIILSALNKELCHYTLMKDYRQKQIDLSFPEQTSCEFLEEATKKKKLIKDAIELVKERL